MRRTFPITIVFLAAIGAAAAIWFWALQPLGFFSYLHSPGATDAEIIRQYWPHDLVRPEWLSAALGSHNILLRWHFYEALARLSVIGAIWFVVSGAAIYRFGRRDSEATSGERRVCKG